MVETETKHDDIQLDDSDLDIDTSTINDTKQTIEESEEIEDDKKFTWTRDKIMFAILFGFIAIVTIALLIIAIVDNTFLFNVIINYFLKPIHQLHYALKVLIFFGFMILQSIIAPIPSEFILTTGGILFRWWGIPIGVVGSMLSATISYYIAKKGGRSIVDASGEKSKFIDSTILIFDEWIKRWGVWAIILCRAIPFVAFDNVSYAAGLAKIKDGAYLLSTFIGCFPRTAFYSFMGIRLLGDFTIQELIDQPVLIEDAASQFNTMFFIILGIMIASFIASNIMYYVREKKRKKEEAEKQEQAIEDIVNEMNEDEIKEVDVQKQEMELITKENINS